MNVRAERLDLGPGLRAHVVGADHRAEPAGGADRLQAGDAGPEHQHLGRPGRAGRGDQQREEPAERRRGDQGGLVAGDVRLRGQRVHRLGPGQRPRHQVEADRGDAGLGQAPRQVGVRRAGRAGRKWPGPARSSATGRRPAADHSDHVGVCAQSSPGHDAGARLGVHVVAVPRAVARARLDKDLEPGGAQLGHGLGHQRDPAFSRRCLLSDGNLHGKTSCLGNWTIAARNGLALGQRGCGPRESSGRTIPVDLACNSQPVPLCTCPLAGCNSLAASGMRPGRFPSSRLGLAGARPAPVV